MDLVVRKAEKGDMARVLELITELAVFENEPDEVEITVKELQQAGFGSNPQFTCFVAETDKTIVGMALVYFRFSTWKGRTIHLEDLIVTDAMRGKGIGMALYTRVMKYAVEEGVKRVNWVVLDWNKGAIKFYERTGAEVMSSWWQVAMNENELYKFIEGKT